MTTTFPFLAGEPSIVDCLEQTTPLYTATLVDETMTPVPAASLATLRLTFYTIDAAGAVHYINSRNNQNVLNANNCTIDANGLFTWQLQVADTSMIEAIPNETHIALITWTWAGGAKTGRHELHIVIKNLAEVS
jgi:hypothetical protein